ncbi:MAG: YczE/YyaS/YitT family protein [Acidimicrobiia bacterium]
MRSAPAPRVAPWGTPRRWGVFVVGLCCLITGIALAITADLGVGSWQVLETGLVEATGLPYGTVVLLEASAALALAWLWLGERPWIATVVLAFGGIGIGALLDVLETPDSLVGRGALLAVGMALLAVGVAFYLASDLGASAQDALFVGFYRRYEVRPAVVRFGLDASAVAAGFALGGQLGVGTVVLTFAVPAMIEPALRLGHRLADTPLPAALERPATASEVLAEEAVIACGDDLPGR